MQPRPSWTFPLRAWVRHPHALLHVVCQVAEVRLGCLAASGLLGLSAAVCDAGGVHGVEPVVDQLSSGRASARDVGLTRRRAAQDGALGGRGSRPHGAGARWGCPPRMSCGPEQCFLAAVPSHDRHDRQWLCPCLRGGRPGPWVAAARAWSIKSAKMLLRLPDHSSRAALVSLMCVLQFYVVSAHI